MKTTIFILISLLGLSTAALAQGGDSSKQDGIQTIRIKTSAVCDMCQETLEKAMAYEKGVKKSHLDVASKVLTVAYDAKKTNPEKIRKAVTLAGYDADEMQADVRAYDNLNACCKKDFRH